MAACSAPRYRHSADPALVVSGPWRESSDSLKAFGAALKAFRERSLLTQEQLAERLNYWHASVASIEQGRRIPTARFVERAEEVLEAFGRHGGEGKPRVGQLPVCYDPDRDAAVK
ncbi:helix-turn-helix domain-containing protein, partial [Streptomyces sp. NPDC052701]|uniref:helix-turn-helix domain-containing protein n=1 Tax=Streptomyces sp. NPDC052701 TaxID=3155533 RepID=UPI00341FD18B